jgi:hypothetical protein
VRREKKVEKNGRRFLLLIIVLPGKNNSKINESFHYILMKKLIIVNAETKSAI